MGICSSIGMTVEENFRALVEQKPGISGIEHLKTKQASHIRVGEIKTSNDALEDLLNLPKNHRLTRTALLGLYAAKQAVADAGIEKINAVRTGLISSTSVAGMDLTEKYFQQYVKKSDLRRYIPSHHAGDGTNQMADFMNLKGMVSTISTACSSAANAIMLGATYIQRGLLDRVIVGGTDALSKFTINGFNTLMILSDSDNTPFDEDRKGLNLGEAAAYLVLESQEQVSKHHKPVWAYLTGYGNANDAFHQTASSENGEGAYLAMKEALSVAGLSPGDIDYINVHGTATSNNDLSEGRALERLFPTPPLFSSTKPYTGHTLAAAGAIEAVYSILALQRNTVFPNLNFRTKMKALDLLPNTEVKHVELQHVLSNSFGFGGNCSSLIFSKG